jgi:penicillin-binding protein activator
MIRAKLGNTMNIRPSLLSCTSRIAVLGFALAATTLTGCNTVSSPVVRFDREVNYGDSKAVELVTNEFGSTDLQMIAEKMTQSLLDTPIFTGRPTVTISTVKNKTSEYIDTKNIMNTIQTTLVKSGKVRFTRSIDEMQAGVDELQRQNQSGLYKKDSTAKMSQMKGAKYSLEGELTSIVKQNSQTKDVYYKFTLKMYDVEEGTIEWQEEKDIRKTSKR